MAEDKPKNSATSQGSKRRSPNRLIVALTKLGYLEGELDGELGHRDDFVVLASRREWKTRLYDLINTHYFKTPLQKRQWDKLLDIAAECARTPGTAEIDSEKRGRMVDFLCWAIYRSEFKDDKGRMQVVNLHPSPIWPIRLDLKWLEFDQLLAFAKKGYLFIRRRECIDCFARNKIDFPRTWVSSELTGPEVPNTRSLPAQTIVVADQAAPKANLVRWLENEVSQLIAAGKLPDRITDCARLLEPRLSTAADSDKNLRRVKARHIENTLRTCGLFPKRRSK
jgi:hypothetical protein